jgi:hypothetical protein
VGKAAADAGSMAKQRDATLREFHRTFIVPPMAQEGKTNANSEKGSHVEATAVV